jgi:hypothetical protein
MSHLKNKRNAHSLVYKNTSSNLYSSLNNSNNNDDDDNNNNNNALPSPENAWSITFMTPTNHDDRVTAVILSLQNDDINKLIKLSPKYKHSTLYAKRNHDFQISETFICCINSLHDSHVLTHKIGCMKPAPPSAPRINFTIRGTTAGWEDNRVMFIHPPRYNSTTVLH